MAAPATNSEFLELVRKSEVADNIKLNAHVDHLRKTGALPPQPRKLAGVLVRDGLLTQFQAEQIILGKWRRFTIGKYKVLERLGSGGMGSVYLCEHKLMKRRVAVKVLPTARAADPSSLERFYREARAVAALDHPNIVHAYDIDQDGTLHFLVMEYVDGASLQEIVKKSGPLDALRGAKYIHDAALGLDHAHQAGLVHRDIKPANVLVDRIGVVKLLDLGLARFFNDEDDELTKKYDENVLGTADYLAPEQALDSHSVDIRADIYGLGATFYFLLSGHTPFGEGTVAQKLIWHQTRQPKDLTEYRQDIPEEICAIMRKMMAKDPEQRYAVPSEVAHALGEFLTTPIAPPTEAEMPRLSLAATGGPPSEPTVISTKPKSASPSHKSWTVSRSSPSSVSDATTSGRSSVSESSPSNSVWENITSDTENITAQGDTAPKSSSVRIPQQPNEQRRAQRLTPRTLILLAIAGVLVFAAVAWGVFQLFREAPDPVIPSRSPLIVMDLPKGAYAFSTIQAALRRAKSGDVIEIHRAVVKENVTVAPKYMTANLRNVTIRAKKNHKVIWKTAFPTDPRKPLLHVNGSQGFQLSGEGIVFDGSSSGTKKLRDLVRLSMLSPGTKLHGAAFENYERSAVYVVNFAGTEENPCRLDSLQINTQPTDKKKGAAILLEAFPNTPPEIIDFFRVGDSCQFVGMKPRMAIRVNGKKTLGANVQLPGFASK